MTNDGDLLAVLERELGDRYVFEREIGRGGMAVVFLAKEIRHNRSVALKVLKPDLAAAVGAVRFLREIALIASLEHPHIVPLFDSGEVAGLPYYVMPFISGDSLESLLRREKQLPIETAIELARQVALAIDYAHTRGIIHRDIKPQNILVSDGHALVADFGIARAVVSAGADRLTSTGIAVGSLHYMSPEQATGTNQIDRRSDIYSLGCVVYELLIGEPPFRGPTPQAIIARHNLEAVPDLRIVRNTISLETERVVKKALAKVPADRYRTATEFAMALRASLNTQAEPLTTPVYTSATVSAATPVGTPLRTSAITAIKGRHWALAVVIALVAFGAYLWPWSFNTISKPTGVHTLAVLPFRLVGEKDPNITSHGIVQSISTRLSGTELLQPIDPAIVLPRWARDSSADGSIPQEQSVAIASALGAEYALVGTVERNEMRVTVSGTLYATRTKQPVFQIPRLTGSRQSVDSLLDLLAIAVLSDRLGEGWRRPEELSTNSVDAVKAYANGVLQYRRGRYRQAAAELERATQRDPEFALAQLKLGMVHTAEGNVESEWQAYERAWNGRAKLGRTDRLTLDKLGWERLQETTHTPVATNHRAALSYADQQSELEWLADSVPDVWEAKYALGSLLFSWGPMLGRENSHGLARVAFEQTLRIDSAFAPSLERLVDLAAIAGDTANVRRYGQRFLALNTGADHADYVRWRMAVVAGDSVARKDLRNHFTDDSVDRNVLEQIVGTAQLDGVALEDAVAAAAALRKRNRDNGDLWTTAMATRQLALNMGRRSDTAEFSARGTFVKESLDDLFATVEGAFWSGDPAVAARIADVPIAIDPDSVRGAFAPANMQNCTVGLWRLAHKQTRDLGRIVAHLQSIKGAADTAATMYIPVCAATLRAGLAWLTHDGQLSASLDALDSVLKSGPVTSPHIRLAARLTLATIRDQTGQPAEALALVSQRPYHLFGVTGLTELLLREARLSLRTGDTARAENAYVRYLTLRANAAPPLDSEYRRVRAEFDSLEKSKRK
ncbi:MAG: protein kinase [Gemmatimonas sp.]